MIKEARIREASHQISIPGEKLKTTSKNMNKNYEETLYVSVFNFYILPFLIIEYCFILNWLLYFVE